MKKPLLFISHRIPYPPNKGDKIRSYHILKHLSRDHDVYLASHIDDPRDIGLQHHLKPYVKEMCFGRINPRTRKLASALQLLRGRPMTTRYFYSGRVQDYIDKVTSRIDFPNVFCSSSPSAEYLFRSGNSRRIFRNASTIMDLIDVDSDKWRQYFLAGNFPFRHLFRKESENLLVFERRIAETFRHVILTSAREKALFQEYAPQADSVSVLSNGVNFDYFKPRNDLDRNGGPPVIVFTGVMNYYPNEEGVIWFSRQVFPILKKKAPRIRLDIVGADPSAAVGRLARIDGVRVTGFVQDVRIYIASADVCIAPLRIARGIQNKVLEAMAMARPVVATPQAMQGIEADEEEGVFTAETAEKFVEQVSGLVKDREVARNAGLAARRCVTARYSWDLNLRPIERLLACN